MSPSIRGPQTPPPDEFQGGPRRLDSAYSRPPERRHELEETVTSFINAVHSWPGALKTPELGPPDAYARLGAIEDWTRQASKTAARMESKVLWSLMALESRISQSQDEAREAKERIEDAPAMMWQALQELQAQSAEMAARIEAKFVQSLETLEEKVARSQEESAESRKVLEDIPGLVWQALQELKSQSAEMAAQGQETVLKSLEGLESQVTGTQQGNIGNSSEAEERVIRSLEAIQDRVVSAQDEASEARKNLDSLTFRLDALTEQQHLALAASAQLGAQIGEHVLPSIKQLNAQILPALSQLESRTAELQKEFLERRASDGGSAAAVSNALEQEFRKTQKHLEESPAMLRQVLEELQTSSTERAALTETRFLSALDDLQTASAKYDARTETKFLLGLEALESRLVQLHQESGESRKALGEIPSLIWQTLQDLNPRWATMAVDVQQTVNSLEALEARIAQAGDEAGDALQRLDSLTLRIETMAGQQHETFQAATQLASRLDDHVLPSIRLLHAEIAPALRQLENRTAELQKESADGWRSVGDLAALFSKGLRELMAAERSSAQLIEKNSEQTRRIRSELTSKLQEIYSTITGRVDSLEKKVDASVRTSLSNWERFLEALELLEHKFSSIMRSIEETRAQSQNSAKRSDARVLRALETLEAAIIQLRGAGATPVSSTRHAVHLERENAQRRPGGPGLEASTREDRLVSLTLNKEPERSPTESSP